MTNNKELTYARLYAGLSLSDAAALFGRSLRTWRRWEHERAPAYVLPLLDLLGGDLGMLGWPGWRLHRGVLYAPDLKYGWRQRDLYAQWWQLQQLRHLERQLREVRHGAGSDRAASGDVAALPR